MTWGNRLILWFSAACCMALATAANSINDRWLVPSGEVAVDHTMLLREMPKVCALTFDDGPDEDGYTLEVLQILEQYSIRATFFLIGRKMEEFPDQVTALRNAGHEIGNHSYDHPDLTTISRAAQERQLERTNAIMARFGLEPRWFRPPYGAHSSITLSVAEQQGVAPINWSVDPRDWSAPGVEVIQQRVLNQTGPGAVILLHSTNPQTVAALPGIIEGLQRRGYQFLNLTQWSQLISGNRELEEVIHAPRPVDPQWEEFFRPFSSETIETVVTLPEDEREPVFPLRVFSNFSAREGITRTFDQGGLARFVETGSPSILKRPSQFREAPSVLQTFIRPAPDEPVAEAAPAVLNTTIVEAGSVQARSEPVATLPAAGFEVPPLEAADEPPDETAFTLGNTVVLSFHPLNEHLLTGVVGSDGTGMQRRDMVLLQWATAKLSLMSNNDLPFEWDLPPGIELRYYRGGDREVIVLTNRSEQAIELELPDALLAYLLVSINEDRKVIGTWIRDPLLRIDQSPVILRR